jgi:hypothetical protein
MTTAAPPFSLSLADPRGGLVFPTRHLLPTIDLRPTRDLFLSRDSDGAVRNPLQPVFRKTAVNRAATMRERS